LPGHFHGNFIVADEEELRGRAHARDQPRVARGVGIIERRVHFVEQAKRCRVQLEDGKHQRNGGERLLAAGEQLDGLVFLARRLRHDLHPGVEDFLARDDQARVPAAKQLAKQIGQVPVDILERVREQRARLRVDAADGLFQRLHGFREVLHLRGQKVFALARQLQLLQRGEVDGPERFDVAVQALDIGIPATWPTYILHKMVKVVRGGQEVKVSKRAGSYITLRELVDWVGKDAVRFFLIQRRADTEFVFDIDLALSKSEENPVYYIQYAHARIGSLLRQAAVNAADLAQADLTRLQAPGEFALLRRLAEYPSMLALAAQDLAPHQIAFWLRECAADFHAWYGAERTLVDDAALRGARLRLAHATAQVLKNGLALLGVSAPEKM